MHCIVARFSLMPMGCWLVMAQLFAWAHALWLRGHSAISCQRFLFQSFLEQVPRGGATLLMVLEKIDAPRKTAQRYEKRFKNVSAVANGTQLHFCSVFIPQVRMPERHSQNLKFGFSRWWSCTTRFVVRMEFNKNQLRTKMSEDNFFLHNSKVNYIQMTTGFVRLAKVWRDWPEVLTWRIELCEFLYAWFCLWW